MRFRVIFTADIHGYLFPTDYYTDADRPMGLLKLMPVFDKDENTLLLDGGDTIQGSPLTSWAHRTNAFPHPCARLYNLAGYDYVTIGNHDLDYGTAFLRTYLEQLGAKCVCANLRDREGNLPVLLSAVHTLPNGVRVGITGVCTQQLMRWEKKDVLSSLVIEDPVKRAREELDALQSACDFTVCIYHGGFSRDPVSGKLLSEGPENQGEEICALGYDLVLCGHQHRSMAGMRVGSSFTVQVSNKGTECCVLEACGERGAWHISCAMRAASAHVDERGERLLREDEQAVQEWLDLPAGRLSSALTPAGHIRSAYLGSPMANLINRVQADAAETDYSACSLPNIIPTLPREVSIRDILTAYPFPNTLVVLHMRYDDLKRYLEQCAAYFALKQGGVAAISERYLVPKAHHYHYDFLYGLSYEVDLSRPEGSRVGRIFSEKGAGTIGPGTEMDVCFNSYRASGIGGFSFLKSLPVVREVRTQMRSLIISYFRHHPLVETDAGNPVRFVRMPIVPSDQA